MSEIDPWIVREPKQYVPSPNGLYNGVFKGIEDFALKDGEVKWRFSWEVLTGPETGKVATALTDRGIGVNAHPGRLIAGLLGRSLVGKERVKDAIQTCIGKKYLVSIQNGPQGGKPSVQNCSQPPDM